MTQITRELDELQSLSKYSTSLSSYIYLNITALSKILKKFDKKFAKSGATFTRDFILEQFEKKNSDLLYIYQYKILDEVGACVEQLANELQEHYHKLSKDVLLQRNNANLDSLNNNINEENLLQNDVLKDGQQLSNNGIASLLSPEETNQIKTKFTELNTSIGNMEAFYQSTLKIFVMWRKYVKKNEYKSHIYSVKSISNLMNDGESNEKQPKHFMSSESYWNIRIILTQAFIMSMCLTYVYPTMYSTIYSELFLPSDNDNDFMCFICGSIIAMSPFGGLISMSLVKVFGKKSYKTPMIISSVLSVLGNLLFVLAIINGKLFLLFIGRLIIGFSSNTPVHRQYLLYFIPKRKLSKYFLYFKFSVLSGVSAGPLLSLLCSLIYESDQISITNNKSLNIFTVP